MSSRCAGRVPNDAFRYTAKQWKPIAVLLGGWKWQIKGAIESIISVYLSAPTADQERVRIEAARKQLLYVSTALFNAWWALDEVGWDYNIGGESLQKELAAIAWLLEHEADELRWAAPPNAANPRRERLLSALCSFWYNDLGRSDAPSVDRHTSKAKETPAVAFLKAATNPIFGNHRLTNEMARHAIDQHFGRNRQKKKRKVPIAITRPAEPPDPPEQTPSLPDEFDLDADEIGKSNI